MTLGILALDLSRSTGWALRRRDGTVASGVESFRQGDDEHPAEVLLRFKRWVNRMITAVDMVVWERVVGGSVGMSARSFLFVLESQVMLAAFELGAETRTVFPSTLKKHATGNGRAKKPEMIAAALKRWPNAVWTETLSGSDEADALCVLAWAIDQLEPKEATT